MNFIKKGNSLYLGLLLIGLYSCNETKEITPEASVDYTTEQIEKIADNFNYSLESEEKIEYQASKEYVKQISDKIDKLVLNQKTSLKSVGSNMVGVVMAAGHCGPYRKIRVYYDCEDKSPSTKVSGFHGNWVKTGKKNLIMYFCEVPYDGFGNIGQDYAVLRLSTDLIYPEGFDEGVRKLYHLDKFMDAEDKNNSNELDIYNNDGSVISDNSENLFFAPNYVSGNLFLSFICFPANEPVLYNNLPKLGFDYGVFGTLSGYGHPDEKEKWQGYFYTDDEDRHNSNYMKLKTYDRYHNNTTLDLDAHTTYNKILFSSGNSKFYMTKVTQ